MNQKMKSVTILALLSAQAMMATACSSDSDDKGPLNLTVFTADDASNGVTSTLLAADDEAFLVDAQLTRSQATRAADLIAKSGKKLKAIYITHAHPDHAFGLEIQVITETRAYIEEFNDAVAGSATGEEVEQKMLAKHGALKFPDIPKYSAQAAIAEKM